MQSTSAILAVGAWRDASRADAELLARWRAAAPSLAASGACLGAHFGAWVAGLQNTSLAHSLLLVCCTPLLLALGALAMGFDVSRGEVAGAALGVAGVALVATDAGSGGAPSGVTWAGDVLSLGGAAFIVGYMLVGHKLRAWMPLFMYAFPVTLVAAVALALASLIAREDVIIIAANDHRRDATPPRVVLGWLLGGDWRTFLVVSYLAVGPGLVGHTGYNAVLKHVSPLVVSVSLTLEPLLGTVLGYAAGVADAPGWRTAIGGAAMTVAVAVVVVAEANRKRRNHA
jgi:drug/metabolite transporter (DMT)-like permease